MCELSKNSVMETLKEMNEQELGTFDVRKYVLDAILPEASLSPRASCRKKEELEQDKKNYADQENHPQPNSIVVKTAIGKKWAKTFDYDYDASYLSNYIFLKTIFSTDESSAIEPCTTTSKYEYMVFSHDTYFRGDTMNSWSTTLNEFIRVHGKDYICGYKGRYIPGGYESWEDFLANPENYKCDMPKYITEFMDVVYTIGNFVPVPLCPNFNTNRSQPTKDYWDLTLLSIYEYYTSDHHGSKSNLKKLFQYEGIKNWLDRFGDGQEGWSGFVKSNFMESFVEKNEDGRDDCFGMPKELWDGHFEGAILPEEESDFEKFFKNAKRCICARGERIAKAFKKGTPK